MQAFLNISKVFIILFILALVAHLVLSQKSVSRKVLVVHSYNKDLSWVNEINEGVNRSLAATQTEGLNVRTHYMDLKNHPNCNFYKNAAADVRFTIEDWKPEVIVLVDDLAQALVGFNQLENHDSLDRKKQATIITDWLIENRCEQSSPEYFGLNQGETLNVPQVIFAGVNGTVERYGYTDANNVSGIYEHKNYQALIETLQTLINASQIPVKNIQMLNDQSPTAETENENFKLQDWSPLTTVDPISVGSFSKWQQEVLRANENNNLLIVTNYQNITQGECLPSHDQNTSDCTPIDPSQVIAWTERNALLPVLGANTNFVADGGLMTVAISGIEQGEVAMDLAIEKLEGNKAVKRLEAEQFLIGMNQSLVRKRQLKLPKIYEAFSREIGQFVEVVEHLYMEQGSLVNE